MRLGILSVLVVFSLFSYVQSQSSSPSPSTNARANRQPKLGRPNKGSLPKLPKGYKKHGGMKEKWWKLVVKNIKKIKHLAAKKKNKEKELPYVLEDSIVLGDVAMTPPQTEDFLAAMSKIPKGRRRKRKVINYSTGRTKKWTLPIAYKIHPTDFTPTQQFRIHQAVYHLHAKTCLSFEFHQAYEELHARNYILFQKSTECWSYLGEVNDIYRLGPQPINLNDKCANWIGDIIHELGHAVGLIHEHQRPDRDNFLWVRTDNIKAADIAQFEKWGADQVLLVHDINFDFKSVMQYAATAYSKNFLTTIQPHEVIMKQEMGQPTRASFRDIQAINYIYCTKCSETYPTCRRGGYLRPPRCSYCNCPSGFAGNTCEQIASGYGGCSPSNSGTIQVNDRVKWNCLQSPNHGTGHPYPYGTQCNWLLKAPSSTDKIEARFVEQFGIPCRDFWTDAYKGSACVHWVEIRTHTTHTPYKGARFCCSQRPSVTLESAGEMMVLFDSKFNAIPPSDIPDLMGTYMKGFKLCYKLVDSSSSPCASNPCKHQGTCIVSRTYFHCICNSNYKGLYCEQLRVCSSNPCQNGGTCYENLDSYLCGCPPYYHGSTCQYRWY